MKELFKGFYTPSEQNIKKSWSDNKTLFVFDTNVLLNLYSYTETTRDDFFSILDNISEKVWLPYHVGLEYQRNRLTVIKSEKAIFNDLNEYLNNLEKNIETAKLQELKLNQRLPELDKKTKKLHENIKKLITSHKKEIDDWNKKQPDVRSGDKIRKRIDKVFDKKIGSAPENQKWLDDLYKDGQKRYELNVPPGYMDKKDKEDKSNYIYANLEYVPMYGDLIIWKQIIEKVKDEQIDSLIFVTDDVKEDWWYILNSNGKKEIGARAELRDEIYSNSKISSFEILRTTDFMKNGKEILELSVNEASINEAKTNFENKRHIYKMKLDEEMLKRYDELAELNSPSITDLINEKLKSFQNKQYDYLIHEKLKKDNVTSQDSLYEKIKRFELLHKNDELNKQNTLLDKLKAFDNEISSSDLESYVKKRKNLLEKLRKLEEDEEI